MTDRGEDVDYCKNISDQLALGMIRGKANDLAMKWIQLIDVTFSNGVQMFGVNRLSVA